MFECPLLFRRFASLLVELSEHGPGFSNARVKSNNLFVGSNGALNLFRFLLLLEAQCGHADSRKELTCADVVWIKARCFESLSLREIESRLEEEVELTEVDVWFRSCGVESQCLFVCFYRFLESAGILRPLRFSAKTLRLDELQICLLARFPRFGALGGPWFLSRY